MSYGLTDRDAADRARHRYRFACECIADDGRPSHWLAESPEPKGCPECGQLIEPIDRYPGGVA